MAEQTNFLTGLLEKNSFIMLLGIIVLSTLVWLYIFYLSSVMSSETIESKITGIVMPQMEKWSSKDVLTTFFMWSVMMIAMMLPSATPMILTFFAINKKHHSLRKKFTPTWIFISGYLLVWIGFSLLATIAQWSLHTLALTLPASKIITPTVSVVILTTAGIYQFTPIKKACLKSCQSPLSFILGNWREGKLGSFIMGLQHGLYCLGCCWVLMGILLVVGVMNLLWVAIIAIFIFIEKVVQFTNLFSNIGGILLIGWGLGLILV